MAAERERMKFKTRELSLMNLIGVEVELDAETDMFEQVMEVSGDFKRLLVQNGYYTDGPAIYQYMPFEQSKTLALYTTIGNAVNIVGENKMNVKFEEQFGFTTDYYYRHYDEDEKIPYNEIQSEIEKAGHTLASIYHVILDLYGDMVLDLYCEVK